MQSYRDGDSQFNVPNILITERYALLNHKYVLTIAHSFESMCFQGRTDTIKWPSNFFKALKAKVFLQMMLTSMFNMSSQHDVDISKQRLPSNCPWIWTTRLSHACGQCTWRQVELADHFLIILHFFFVFRSICF